MVPAGVLKTRRSPDIGVGISGIVSILTLTVTDCPTSYTVVVSAISGYGSEALTIGTATVIKMVSVTKREEYARNLLKLINDFTQM
jgi:hypothetical protein